MESVNPFPLEKFVLSARGFAVTVLVVLFSVFSLDGRIALWVEQAFLSNVTFSRYAEDIPDLLLPAVLLGSTWMWVSYTLRVRRHIVDERTLFFRAAGSAMPAAYALKTVLKIFFGRINTRAWLEAPTMDTFDWFHGGGIHNGFPSGHMTVFTSLAVTAWLFFPRCRAILLFITLALGAALIATDFHFLSDVIAGGYLGSAVAAAALRVLAERPPGNREIIFKTMF